MKGKKVFARQTLPHGGSNSKARGFLPTIHVPHKTTPIAFQDRVFAHHSMCGC